MGRGAKVLHTDIHTDPPTKWVLEEFSLLKSTLFFTITYNILSLLIGPPYMKYPVPVRKI